MKTIVHVNQHVIRHNLKTGDDQPIFTVKQGRKNRYAASVEIHGPSRLVYSPNKPLSCGARAWIETTSEVELLGEKTLAQVKQNLNSCQTT